MKIVPEELFVIKARKSPDPDRINDAEIWREGHNTCRQTVLNNLKSKEMVEGIAKILAKEDDGLNDKAWEDIMKAKEHFGDCTDDPEACFVCLREMYFKTALAIQKALIQ